MISVVLVVLGGAAATHGVRAVVMAHAVFMCAASWRVASIASPILQGCWRQSEDVDRPRTP